jgi:hypothetical protein
MSGNVVPLKTAADDEAKVAKALQSLRRDLVRSECAEPTERQIVEAALRLCIKVDRAATDDSPRAFGNSMPTYTRTIDERLDDAAQRIVDHHAGDLPDPVEIPTAAEITSAEAIERVFRAALVGKDTARGWRIIWNLASKRGTGRGSQTIYQGSIRDTAQKFGLDPKQIRRTRERQLEAITNAIRHLLPTPEYRTGIIHQAA